MNTPTFGTLLRGWRDRLSPIDAGLPGSAKRRAPGLRREELALLAGLSVDYVLRLEQGRSTAPSAQVVAALARALQLSRAERDQLFHAAGLLPPRDGTVDTHVPPGIQRLVARLGDVPIGVFAADWTLLWWNDMWAVLLGDLTDVPVAERNVARAAFGDGPMVERTRLSQSADGAERFRAAIVADLKVAVSRYPADARLGDLVTHLRGTSPDFARRWEATAPAVHTSERKTITHPAVGDLTLDCDVLTVPGADLRLVTYTTAAGSPDAGKLDLLRVTRGVTV